MDATTALSSLTDQPVLDPVAEPLSKAIRAGYESAGPAGRQLKNALHGVWLKHPLHPVFTDAWHGSEFALADGRVINGPATHDQPCFDVRERTGRIEVKQRG